MPAINYYLEALRKGGYQYFWENIRKPTMSYQFHENFIKTYIGSYLIRYLFEDRYARMNADPSGSYRNFGWSQVGEMP